MSPEHDCIRIQGGNGAARETVDLPGLRVRLAARPADGERGGDLHVLSACTEMRITRLVVADAAGHGPVAAGASRAILDSLRDMHHVVDNAVVLRELDRLLGEGLVTATSATLHVDTGELFYGYAGPPAAFHFSRATGVWSHLQAVCSLEAREEFVGLPLGVLPGGAYCQSRTHLDEGDLLVLFTDGLHDRDGLDVLLARCRSVAEPTPEAVEAALLAGAEGTPDDLTLLVAERTAL
jgi:serine phosphatase RsbU (regulator of sigma subunit)